MSRVTQLSRSVTAAASRASPLLDSTAHGAGAAIMPKYADLLMKGRSSEQHDARSITTAHRPTPQPSLANRTRPLMQTFSSSSAASSSSHTLDATIIPTSFSSSSATPVDHIRVPLLPDNYSSTYHTMASSSSASAEESKPEVTIVASDPENVSPGSGLVEVSAAGGPDVVDLGFMRGSGESQGKGREEEEGGMLKDLWKGMVDDIFGGQQMRKA